MVPAAAQHRFGSQQEYTVQRYTRGGERRIMQAYALDLSLEGVLPGLLQALDGDARYWEAVLKECLIEAPEHWWEAVPPGPSRNGSPSRTLSFEAVPVEEFTDVSKEVQTWFDSFRRPAPSTGTGAGQGDPAPLADPEAVSASFRGRAS